MDGPKELLELYILLFEVNELSYSSGSYFIFFDPVSFPCCSCGVQKSS